MRSRRASRAGRLQRRSGRWPRAAPAHLEISRSQDGRLTPNLGRRAPSPTPALRPAASEPQLLALLWTLESWDNVWRSPCTAVLHSYLRHLAAFDREVRAPAPTGPAAQPEGQQGRGLASREPSKALGVRLQPCQRLPRSSLCMRGAQCVVHAPEGHLGHLLRTPPQPAHKPTCLHCMLSAPQRAMAMSFNWAEEFSSMRRAMSEAQVRCARSAMRYHAVPRCATSTRFPPLPLRCCLPRCRRSTSAARPGPPGVRSAFLQRTLHPASARRSCLAASQPTCIPGASLLTCHAPPALRPFHVLLQLDLLKRLGWQVRLDFRREVAPCRDLLFRHPIAPATPHAAPAAAAAPLPLSPATPLSSDRGAGLAAGPAVPPARSAREAWVLRMEGLCAEVAHAAAAARAQAALEAILQGNNGGEGEEEGEPFTPAAAKRPRLL